MSAARRLGRDALVFTISLAVVLFLAAYALSDPGLELAAATGDVRGHAGRQALVEGRILESNGSGLASARVEMQGPAGTRVAYTGRQGFFRLAYLGSCATYRIALRGRSHDRDLVTRLKRRLCPGDAVEVEARVVADGQFIWMPSR